MAQFWIAIFFIFLAVAQLYQSIKDINLPLPVYLVLGVMLAVASNSQQQLSFTPAPETTSPQLKESEPILSLIPAPLPQLEESQPILSLIPTAPVADDIKLSDSNTLVTLSAAPLIEVVDEIQPVDIETPAVISTEPPPLTEVPPAQIEPVESEIVPIFSTDSVSPPAEIPSAENTQPIDIAAPLVSLAATEPSPPEIPATADEMNPVDSEEPPVALAEQLPEVTSKQQAKPVAKKTTRKKSTSSKTRK